MNYNGKKNDEGINIELHTNLSLVAVPAVYLLVRYFPKSHMRISRNMPVGLIVHL